MFIMNLSLIGKNLHKHIINITLYPGGGFCYYAKLDSSYQVSKIAEIFSVNQQGALEKQQDPGH